MNASVDLHRVRRALRKTTTALLTQLGPAGHWTGELSSSALSTAVATIALGQMGETNYVNPSLRWLAENVNPDGGWGDTIRSQSNLSTTALVWAAFGAATQDAQFPAIIQRAETWLWKNAGSREQLPNAIAACYGKDRTFSVPILMTLALSGRLGENGWQLVPALPFELAAFPRSWFGALQLPVVSYALPALIAIGQTIHFHSPSKNPLRSLVKNSTLRLLTQLQPTNGGFLEATPLTAFVTMSLASMEQQNHPVAKLGAAFLRQSMRPDGNWPIDTNLSTWLTTLSVKALSHQTEALDPFQKRAISKWLLAQQYQTKHPYTGAAPGGWAWTDLPGGVPDADDTAGALLALSLLGNRDPRALDSAEAGITWLLNIQNRDGGVPTFCRGWGALPFDRSSPELTAHAMRAWAAWRKSVRRHPQPAQIDRALARAEKYLARSQRPDGSWIPLWFGNERASNHDNPVYGTAQTLIALNEIQASGKKMRGNAAEFLTRVQLPSGGWGGDANCPETLEETALAVEALIHLPNSDAFQRGVRRLVELVERDDCLPSPIGLYFARLWYYEKLYPLIFATSALGHVSSQQF